ncbi:MAG TPA: VirB8/TrbF family protein [Candidatus Binataceae bacterium]|nr:VirB8/TrbF family protein [Candidatus Binataceae bacterium]
MSANPYVQGWREWGERYADLVLGKRNWQIAAGGLLLATIILAAGMVWLSSRIRYVVYAVEVDKLGYALTQAQPLTASSPPDVIDLIGRYEVASFISQARSVSSDPQVEQRALNALLAHTQGAADHFLDDYYHSDDAAHNPFQIAQKQTVTVQIDSILKISPKIYEVRWTEVRRDLNGAAAGSPTHWEAQLQTKTLQPRDSDTIVSNPLGFYVTNITWTEQQD